MKIRYDIMVILILMGLWLHAEVYDYDYSFRNARFVQQGEYMTVDIPGCMLSGMEGEPLLPGFPVSIVLKPGETMDHAELIVNEIATYPLMLQMLPKQPDRPLSWGPTEQGLMKNEIVYRQENYISKKIDLNVHRYRGVSVLMGSIKPLDYFPKDGFVNIAENVTLRVTTTPSTMGLESRLSARDEAILKDMVQNPSELSSYGVPLESVERMLIITCDSLKSVFTPLVEHYRSFGIVTKVLSVEYISLSDVAGRDIQEKIRNTILMEYLLNGLDYVLIGGDNGIVPARGLSCQVLSGGVWVSSDNIPADLYYAALDGDWDRNGNNIFGEYNDTTGYDEADLLPELAIGRMPVSNHRVLTNMISKSIKYQTRPIIGEVGKHTFFGEFLYADPFSLASDYMELLIGPRDDNGYTTQGIPTSLEIVKWYDYDNITDTWNFSTFKQELADGTSFVHHDGHADYAYMMKFSTWDINDSDFVTVNGIDHMTPLFYSHGCNCGGFDYANCVASRVVTSPYISAGGIFNSRYGWFNEGQTEGPTIHLHREFEHAIYAMHIYQFGWAHTVSRMRTAPWVTAMGQHEQNALRWTYYTQNILGDPALRIYSGSLRQAFANYNFNEIENNVLQASILIGNDPVENVSVAIEDSSGQLIGYARTDAGGSANIVLSERVQTGDLIRGIISGENILPADTLMEVIESSLDVPVTHMLLEAYPNPFNPVTTLRYTLPMDDEITIGIYDVQGKLVKELYHNIQQSGTHEIVFSAADLPSGMYICRLQTITTATAVKLILLK